MPWHRSLSLCLLLLATPVPSQERPQTPTFGTGTGLVLVDFVVTNKDDQTVAGLTAKDFVVKEDGKERPIVSFLAFGDNAAQGPKNPATTEPQPSQPLPLSLMSEAVTVLLVDDGRLTPGQRERLRPALKELLERMEQSSGGLALVAPVSRVFEARTLPEGAPDLKAVIDRIGMAPNNMSGMAYHNAVYDVMIRSLNWLASKPGRHSLVMVSPGFPAFTGDLKRNDVVTSSLRANASIHFMDVRGLEGLSGYRDAGGISGFVGIAPQPRPLAWSIAAEGASSLADDTGGLTIRNGNDLRKGLGRAFDIMKTYYVIGYQPPEHKEPGFRKIRVEVRAGGLRVLARRGYFDEATAGR